MNNDLSVSADQVEPKPQLGKWSLPGDAAWWMFLTAEFTTLCMFFVAFAVTRRSHLEEFQAGQSQLEPGVALVNSLILMTSGYFMARGLHSIRIQSRYAAAWVLLAALLGIAFVGIKSWEYWTKLELGISLSSGSFWFFYYFLTGFHYLHVLFGIGFLMWLANRLRGASRESQPYAPALRIQAESCGAFWHMLDLVWIVLFPLLYLS